MQQERVEVGRAIPVEFDAVSFRVVQANRFADAVVGSGKTVRIRLFLQSIAPRFRVGAPTPEHLVLFEAIAW